MKSRSPISQLIERIRSKPANSESKNSGATISRARSPRRGDTIYRFFYELSWTKWQQVEIYTASVLIAGATLAIWGAVFATSDKPPIEIYPERNARELVRAGFSEDTVNQDQVAKFIIDTLTLLHRADDNGNPYLPLLRGHLNPDIYAKVESNLSRNSAQFRVQGIVQNLNVTRVLDIAQEAETNRISAYVRGYYSIFREPKAGERTEVRLIPYRARVKLEPNIRSEVNTTDFFLFELQEVVGSETEQWDREEGV
jgi:hypothetical protein